MPSERQLSHPSSPSSFFLLYVQCSHSTFTSESSSWLNYYYPHTAFSHKKHKIGTWSGWRVTYKWSFKHSEGSFQLFPTRLQSTSFGTVLKSTLPGVWPKHVILELRKLKHEGQGKIILDYKAISWGLWDLILKGKRRSSETEMSTFMDQSPFFPVEPFSVLLYILLSHQSDLHRPH